MKFLPLFLCILLSACITKKTITQTGIEAIHFGSGGGFTGAVNAYTFTAESELIQNEKMLKKIDLKTTLAIFTAAKALTNYQYNKPGNMYRFIELKTAQKTNRIVWSQGATEMDKKVIECYTQLILLTK